LARAKNTIRSEARRRTREQTRADFADDADTLDDGSDADTEPVAPPRKPFFTFPDVRSDLRALPEMFRTRRLLWLPFIILAVGFVLVLVQAALPVEIQPWVVLYVQYFFLPQALFTYFIGGFLAPRAAYLIGLLLGLTTGVLWAIVLVVLPDTQAAFSSATDVASLIGLIVVESLVLGMFAGGFAGWYRNYLRSMQERSRSRQADREASLKAKRRDERQEQRRAAKQRPTN
jgi:hypothetical protein